MKTKHHLKLFGILLILALFAMSLSAQEESEMSRTGFRPDAPTYGVRGPHPVGTIDMVVDNEERPLPVTIWYPALNPEELEEIYTYPAIYPPVFPPLEVYGMALFEAEPDSENGPYPLVVWSHGFTSFRTMNTYFGEHLASWGFVVIAPDHLGMTASEIANEPATFWPIYYNNPRDVSLVIDFAEQINADGVMAGMIDTENVASTGHSSGGFTALQAAGAQIDVGHLTTECAEEAVSGMCLEILPSATELAGLYGLDAVPDDGLLPSIGDDRIDALVPLAPNNFAFGATGLNAVEVPTLYMAGTADALVPYDEITAGFNSLGSDTAYLVEFDYAGHGVFQDTCERFPAMLQFGFYDLCAEKVWDKLRAQDIINHYGTAFLLWQLKGDETAGQVIRTPDTFPGVEVIAR